MWTRHSGLQSRGQKTASGTASPLEGPVRHVSSPGLRAQVGLAVQIQLLVRGRRQVDSFRRPCFGTRGAACFYRICKSLYLSCGMLSCLRFARLSEASRLSWTCNAGTALFRRGAFADRPQPIGALASQSRMLTSEGIAALVGVTRTPHSCLLDSASSGLLKHPLPSAPCMTGPTGPRGTWRPWRRENLEVRRELLLGA